MTEILTSSQPTQADADHALQALARLKAAVSLAGAEGPAAVRIDLGEGTEPIPMPMSLVELMLATLSGLAGGGVTVVPSSAELTTQQAADILHVSRPHLVKMLEEGRIEYRTVGTHRRVKSQSLIAYKAADDMHRDAAAAELTRLSHELNLP